MNARLTPKELRELLGAYALGALGADEKTQVEAALLDDPDAREELHRLEHAAAWLGHATPRPPAQAWEAVRVEMERDLAAAPATVVPLQPAPASARQRAWRVLAVAAAMLVVVAGAFGLVRALDGGTSAPRVSSNRFETQNVSLRSADGRLEVLATVRADGSGAIRRSGLPAPAAGRTYQLWSITPRGPVSAGVIGADPTTRTFRAAPAATALAITDEPAGGSRAPTTTPLVAGDLQRT